MDTYDKMCLLAQHMRYHESLAAVCKRGSVERQNHENMAQQYRDEILCNNAYRTHTTWVRTLTEK